MKTRIVALFLSLAMLLSLCSFAIAEEPTQLTICIGRRPYDSTESYSEKHWVQEEEKACNLKINWIELPEETMKEQLSSALINTNNLPDIFMCGNKMTDSIVSQNTGLWHVFTMDEIKQYAPTYYEVCEKYIDGWVDATTYPDGNIYSLMGSLLAVKGGGIDLGPQKVDDLGGIGEHLRGVQQTVLHLGQTTLHAPVVFIAAHGDGEAAQQGGVLDQLQRQLLIVIFFP